MSDIQPGDVVVCVDASSKPEWAAFYNDPFYASRLIAVGRYYYVEETSHCPRTGQVGLNIGVALPDGDMFWESVRFRKIDASKTELSERIKACRPIKHREPEHA